MAISEVLTPNLKPSQLVKLEESGNLALSIDCVVDAKSVFDALVAQETKIP
jgi:hypothetical protein